VPLAHVSPKHTPHMWKRYSHLKELQHQNLHFKHGSVKSIDPEAKIAEWTDRSGSVQKACYDFLIVATGLKRHWPAVPRAGSYVEYTQDARELIDNITANGQSPDGRKVIVVGAGGFLDACDLIRSHFS
jgi:apoptosis-inducing factor 2